MFNKLITTLTIFVSMTLASLPVSAQTSDGTTPALEAVCDPLKEDGITKGLYGLCVAYCEAQDFASEEVPLDEDAISALFDAEGSSARILENYERRRRDTDPEMPCIVPVQGAECPCATQAQVDLIDGYHDSTWEPSDFILCKDSDLEDSDAGPTRQAFEIEDDTFSILGIIPASNYCLYRRDFYGVVVDNVELSNLGQAELAACLELIRSAPVCNN